MTATCAIIPASGLGKRLGKGINKVFLSLGGKPLIVRTLAPFEQSSEIGEIILVVGAGDIPHAEEIVRSHKFRKVRSIIAGGEVRQDSVRNGLRAVSPDAGFVAVHDGARPLVTPEIIKASIEAAARDGAAIAAVPVTDTIKSSSDGAYVGDTLRREHLYSIQTPQTFRRDIIEAAYERAYADGFYGTDDASLVERMGLPVRIVQGSYENIKVTTPTDLIIAEALVNRTLSNPQVPRVGTGYDVHRFASGRRLFLGGVEFPGEDGLLGHSDADVLIHAVMDAVLGAAGAGDIGMQFPDTDPRYKDVRSTVLLEEVGCIVAEVGYQVGNVDIMLIAERPRIAGRIPEMRANIAQCLGITPEQVSLKATTAEGLGFVGQGLGIECHAVALVHRVDRG